MKVTQALKRSVKTRGEHAATVFGERTRTWAQVGDRVARVAAALVAMGVRKGDRVAVMALNSDNYVEVLYAVAWAGGIVVPLNTRWALAENRYALGDCAAKVIFVDRNFAPQWAELRDGLADTQAVFMDDGASPDGMVAYEALVASHDPMEDGSGSHDDVFGIFYTGGTTGHPKGVMLTHTNITFAAVIWISILAFEERTVFLHAAGLFHLAGASPCFALTLSGGTHVFLPKFETKQVFLAIEKYRINYCLFVPTMINMLINDPDIDKHDLTSVKNCEYGGSIIPDAVLLKAMEKLPTWQFHQGYGMTETSALVTVLPWRYHAIDGPYARARKSSGREVYGVEMRIVDPEGKPVPLGVVGEIAVRGATVMRGYWNKPEATAAVLRDGWMHTGDAASMDEQGFVYIVDRVKDMIITGGENVYSGEVEAALYQHKAVRECAVIAIPDSKWGEAVHAVVVLKDGHRTDAQSLIEHCRSLIANYKCPKSVEIRTEPLPVSAAGKIQKAVIRKAYWPEGERRIS
jgi:long-chain acyl-CoA synthetase